MKLLEVVVDKVLPQFVAVEDAKLGKTRDSVYSVHHFRGSWARFDVEQPLSGWSWTRISVFGNIGMSTAFPLVQFLVNSGG